MMNGGLLCAGYQAVKGLERTEHFHVLKGFETHVMGLKRFAKRLAVGAGVLLLLTSGSDGAWADDVLKYRLKWLFNASVVGDLYAKDHGFFSREGLNVDVRDGGPERDAIRELELGLADFGAASADQVIRARSKGAPVVVLAQIFQINPLQWIYRSGKLDIRNIGDLKGRVIGITYGGNDEHIMRTLLAMGGLGEKDVTLYSVRYDYTPFYQGKADLWPVYLNSQAVFVSRKLEAAGERVDYFDPVRFGVRFVANSLVTSERMLKNHPETVRVFTRALLAGWDAALDPANAEKALAVLKTHEKDTSPEIQKIQLDITRGLVKPSLGDKTGRVDVDAWKQTENIMREQKQIAGPVDLDKTLRAFD